VTATDGTMYNRLYVMEYSTQRRAPQLDEEVRSISNSFSAPVQEFRNTSTACLECPLTSNLRFSGPGLCSLPAVENVDKNLFPR
jgi:hypothetical protein